MERCFQSVALIPRSHADRSQWFALWRPDQESFNFLTARCGEGESPRDCLDREVSASLELPSKDFLVANMAQINLEFLETSPGEQMPQPVSVTFHLVHMYSPRGREVLSSHPAGTWLTGRELHAGRAADGRAVSPWLTRLLRSTEVVQPW